MLVYSFVEKNAVTPTSVYSDQELADCIHRCKYKVKLYEAVIGIRARFQWVHFKLFEIERWGSGAADWLEIKGHRHKFNQISLEGIELGRMISDRI